MPTIALPPPAPLSGPPDSPGGVPGNVTGPSVTGPGGQAVPTVKMPPPPPLQGAPTPEDPGLRGQADDSLFPHLAVLRVPVAFWTHVFADWSKNQTAIHDMDDLGRVYLVLDFRSQAASMSQDSFEQFRSATEKRALKDLEDDLNVLQKHVDGSGHLDAAGLTGEQRRIAALFRDERSPRRFHDAIDELRLQRGLRERTETALETSGRYLPTMERIFGSYGLPTKLTRLPLVESSFNVDAYSKAAAAGLWQFIPASARVYMRLNEIADDRRDPWTSTDAAARHLKDDYDALGSWPLALTAYNYGRGGLVKALAEVKGTTLTDVIERFHGQRFGFASSNFYAEFLAATDVERHWRSHFRDLHRESPLHFDTVRIADYVPYDTLRRLAGADADQFRTLNPAYREDVVDGHLYVPAGDTIRVPVGSAERFRLAYASLSASQRFDRQRQYYVAYRIRRGDTLGRLARVYGVSTRQILAVNGLSNGRYLRIGRVLKIPPRGGATQLASAGDVRDTVLVRHGHHGSARHTVGHVRLHRVRAGQTLSLIAVRYRTSVSALRELNGLDKGAVLHIGALLKVPATR